MYLPEALKPVSAVILVRECLLMLLTAFVLVVKYHGFEAVGVASPMVLHCPAANLADMFALILKSCRLVRPANILV